MTKNKNALRAGFAEVKHNSKKIAQIRANQKSNKYGFMNFDWEDEEYFDPADLLDFENEEGEEDEEENQEVVDNA